MQLKGDLLAMKDMQGNHDSQGRGPRQDYMSSIRSSEDQRISSKLHRSPCHRHPPTVTWATVCRHMSSRDIQGQCRGIYQDWTFNQKERRAGGKPVYDPEFIYIRVVCLQQYRVEILISQMSSPTNCPQGHHHDLLNRRHS